MMMTCLQFCYPCCFHRCCDKDGTLEETEPLVKRKDSNDQMKEKFQTFRKNVLENSLKDFDIAKEDIRDVTILLSPTGIGNVDAQLSGYATLYNDHLERWKNLKKLMNDFKKSPAIVTKSRVVTFRNSLVAFRKICGDIKSSDGDLHIRNVSDFCLLVDYKMDNKNDETNKNYSAILIFNQINRDLREFIERGPSLARLLKSIAGGVRFQEGVKEPVPEVKGDDEIATSDESNEEDKEEDEEEDTSDPLKTKPTIRAGGGPSHAETEDDHPGICAERENLDASISKVQLTVERRAAVLKRYKQNLELLGKGSAIVEVLDLVAKYSWQNIYDELVEKES